MLFAFLAIGQCNCFGTFGFGFTVTKAVLLQLKSSFTYHGINSLTNSTDVLPPSFGDTCPIKPLLVYTKSARFSAVVNWTVPTATDNSGIPPEVKSNFNHPPQWITEGIHVIIYTAIDMSGNKEFCSITINVTGKWII